MAVGIFPLLSPSQAVSKSGVIMQSSKIKPNVNPGKISPAHGFFILLRKICKIKVPISTKPIIPIPTHSIAERNPIGRNAISLTLFFCDDFLLYHERTA